VRRERAMDLMRFGHDALKLFFAVSTYALIKISDLGASESSTFLAILSVQLTMKLTNRTNCFRSRYLFR
jgi:hypothetical protein